MQTPYCVSSSRAVTPTAKPLQQAPVPEPELYSDRSSSAWQLLTGLELMQCVQSHPPHTGNSVPGHCEHLFPGYMG